MGAVQANELETKPPADAVRLFGQRAVDEPDDDGGGPLGSRTKARLAGPVHSMVYGSAVTLSDRT